MSFAWIGYAIAAVWWPYSLYWWRRGRFRAVERLKVMPQDQRRGWLAGQRTLLRSLRILLLVFPFAGVLLGVMTAPKGAWAVFLLAVSEVLIWLATLDFYMRARHMLRVVDEPERGQVVVEDTGDLPSEESPRKLLGLTAQQWFAVAAGTLVGPLGYLLWLVSEGRNEPREDVVAIGVLTGVSTLLIPLIGIRMFIRNSMPRSSSEGEAMPPAPGPQSSGFGLVIVAALLVAAVVLMSVWRLVW